MQVGDAAADAPWRRERLSHAAFVARQLRCGKLVSALFGVPGADSTVFRRDWLHCVDQGVGADFLGNCFKVFCQLLPGSTKQARRKALLALIREFYDVNGVRDRLVGLRGWGIQGPKSPPKLRCSAACARALIPFCLQTCNALLDASNPKHNAMRIAAHHLNECYKCLSTDSTDWREILPSSSKEFAIQYQALQASSAGKDWRIKPKMHQFLEMCIAGSKPNMSWTYRDEDYGGSIAQLCRIKGGCWRKVLRYSSKMLVLFKTRNRVPRIQ